MPKRGLTAFAGHVASRERGATTTRLVRWFVRKYGVDMSEAAVSDIAAYASFNDFFTRALKPGARPLADADLICPVDGTISQFGRIEHDQILQAKGHRYSTTALVGGDHALAARFHDGSFATLYLSPKDYHRIHMPCDGTLTRMIHVPGALFSVNPTTARGVPGLFARNERVVCVFDSPRVGTLRPHPRRRDHRRQHGDGVARRREAPRVRRVREWNYADGSVSLRAGRGDGPLHARLDRRAALPRSATSASIRRGSRAGRSGSARRWRRSAERDAMRAVFVDANAALRELAEAIGPRALPRLELAFGDADIAPDALPAALAGAPIAVIDHTALPIEVARRCAGLRHVVFLGTGARSYMDPEALAVDRHRGPPDQGLRRHRRRRMRDRPALRRGAQASRRWTARCATAAGCAAKGIQLSGKTLGLIGFGGIAAEMARLAERHRHEGARLEPHAAADAAGVEFVAIDALLARERRGLDAPAAHATRRAASSRASGIAAMRRGALLVNTARGALVDEAAMVEALRSGHHRPRRPRRLRSRAAARRPRADDARQRHALGALGVSHARGQRAPRSRRRSRIARGSCRRRADVAAARPFARARARGRENVSGSAARRRRARGPGGRARGHDPTSILPISPERSGRARWWP